MNTKNNQRFQQKEADIRQVFMELLTHSRIDKITVSEICKKAKINRSTFYAHFIDVYDLLEKTDIEMSKKMVGAFTDHNAKSIGEGFENLFQFIKDNADFYVAYFNNAGNSSILNVVLPDTITDGVVTLIQELGYKSMEEYRYHECFFKSGISGLLKLWLNNGCKETPHELSDIIYREYNQKQSLFDWS